VVSERFPKGGALTLNITGGVGMIGAGVIGAVILGFFQDTTTDRNLREYDQQNNTTLHSQYVTEEKRSIFGDYRAVDAAKVQEATTDEKQAITTVQENAKKEALKSVAWFPVGMFVCYVLLILYFKSKGGYRAVTLDKSSIIQNYESQKI